MTPRFRILLGYSERERFRALGLPKSIPWDVVAPHAQQADLNHGQTLERLNERGGLSPHELLAVLTDRRWRAVAAMGEREVVEQLREIIHDTQELEEP